MPRKNLAICGGRPLIHWTLDVALRAAIGDVAVSTEDQEIAALAYSYGVDVITRPAELATDEASGVAVAIHAARWGQDHGYTHLVYLQPTSPLREVQDVARGVSLMLEHHAPVVAVTGVRERLRGWLGGQYGVVRLDSLSDHDAVVCGTLWGRAIDSLVAQGSMYDAGHMAVALYVPQERALDVDTPHDLHVADLLLRERNA